MEKLQKGEKVHLFSNKELKALIIPLTLESALNMLIGIVDTMMVARAGENAISAVSFVDSISNLLLTLFNAFSTGGAVICSQYLGSKNREKAKETGNNLVFISFFLGLLIMFIILPLRMWIIRNVFGTLNKETTLFTNDYFFYLAISYPFLSIYTSFTALSRSEKKTKRTFYVALFMNAINVFGNWTLIYKFNLATKGAALSTLFSRIIGASIMFMLLYKKDEELTLCGIFNTKVNFSLVKRISKLSIPAGLEGSLFHVGKISVLSILSTLGSSSVAINAIINNFNYYSNIPGNAINLAIITVIGQARGSGNIDEVYYFNKKLILLCYITTSAVNIPLMILSSPVISLYNLSLESAYLARPIALRCLLMCSLLWPLSFSVPATLKALGDMNFIMLTSIVSMFFIRVLGAYFFIIVLRLGVEGVWYAMYLDWTCRSILFTSRFYRGKWKQIKVI